MGTARTPGTMASEVIWIAAWAFGWRASPELPMPKADFVPELAALGFASAAKSRQAPIYVIPSVGYRSVKALMTVAEGAAQCRTLRIGLKNSACPSTRSGLPKIRSKCPFFAISPIKTSRIWELRLDIGEKY
jgi:hypothetical protein